jgi:hypothetical protein
MNCTLRNFYILKKSLDLEIFEDPADSDIISPSLFLQKFPLYLRTYCEESRHELSKHAYCILYML